MSVARTARRVALAVAGLIVGPSLLLVWRGPDAMSSFQSLVPDLPSHANALFHDAIPDPLGSGGGLPPVRDSALGPPSAGDRIAFGPGSTNPERKGPPEDSPAPAPPSITFIVIWSPRPKPDVYLPNFFASVAANPALELLLIKIDKYDMADGECEREHAPGVRGVREVCVPMAEYYALHLEFLCGQWNCTPEQRERVREAMVERFRKDKYNSSYRPFRAEIFSKWMDPETKLWVRNVSVVRPPSPDGRTGMVRS
jgi:hypothetical protein